MFKRLFSILPDKSDSFLYAGLGFIFYGTYLIYAPASFVTLGVLCVVIAFIQAKGGK